MAKRKKSQKVSSGKWPLDLDDFVFDGSRKFSIKRSKTKVEPVYSSKKDYRKQLQTLVKRIDELQAIMNAQDRHGVLLVFQAMDAAGKDGTIRRVLTGVNPAGVQVYAFKKPSAEELDHGYLWRVIQRMPERGRIGVFNRSYYEEVLVVRVHPEILIDYQKLPSELTTDVEAVFESRFDEIRNFERYATNNGIRVIKFFLNVSRDEQRDRLIARLDTPEKNWKFTTSDIDEREYWDDYQAAFQDCINETGCQDAPWAVIPADDKLNMRLIVAKLVVRELEQLNLAWPQADPEIVDSIPSLRKQLLKE